MLREMILILLGLMRLYTLIVGTNTYANHKDMSEFCKRQVSPSMIFGSSLDDSHLNVIYYSKLNVPYSCMVTIRTEPPYIIVLVIDVVSQMNLRQVCAENREPMGVYNVVPAYGGYWGSLPHLVTNRRNHTKAYTLKTTSRSTTSSVQEQKTENITETFYTEKIPTWVEDFVVTKEIPLMNISGNFQLVGRPIQHVEDLLDDDDDVTKKGEDYVTSLVPLVKFSPNIHIGRHMNFNTSDGNPIFQLFNYNTREDSFTIDTRLLFTTERTKQLTKKSKWVANRWKHITKNNNNNFMKNARNNNNYDRRFNPTTYKMYHNFKALRENFSKVTVTRDNSWQMNKATLNIKEWEKDAEENTSLKSDENIARSNKLFLVTNEIHRTSSAKPKTATTHTTTHVSSTVTGKLVDRESWENIVKVAPALANRLNSTLLPDRHKVPLPGLKNKAKSGSINRRRRSFQPINYELAEPRHLDRSADYDDSRQLMSSLLMYYNIRMINNFEMTEDDVVAGRKSMKNLTSSRGSLIVNICELQYQTEWVKVLNTSEILVAVNNFTLDHVRLIVTPGLPLYMNKEQCLEDQVECQIYDKRVCISATLACDSVPNCGTNSTNDEDRVSCGQGSGGGAMTVLSAAVACLLVVVAAAYTLYHWVSRCVPQVAQAFFVYTDQSENTLILHTVMRSPHDMDLEPDPSLSGQFSFIDLANPDLENIKEENLCKRLIRKCFGCMYCIRCNKAKEVRDKTTEQIELTEKELHKTMLQKDEVIQTESSLEMRNIVYHDKVDEDPNEKVKERKELDYMKYVNERAKNLRSSLESENNLANISPEVLPSITEEELESTVYDRKDSVLQKSPPKANKRIKPTDINPIESIEKHLRFLENPTLIPNQSNIQDIDFHNRPSVSGLDYRQPASSSTKGSKEFNRNYWKLPIGKKSKKPAKK